MPDTLFVYGTLRAGGGQNGRLGDGAVRIGGARMAGRLYRLDGYPGLVIPGGDGEWVIGEVYRLRDPETVLAAWDAYEGGDYTREQGAVAMDTGETQVCWVYCYRGPVDEARRIAHGDFLL